MIAYSISTAGWRQRSVVSEGNWHRIRIRLLVARGG